jgi:hypothetical protein
MLLEQGGLYNMKELRSNGDLDFHTRLEGDGCLGKNRI